MLVFGDLIPNNAYIIRIVTFECGKDRYFTKGKQVCNCKNDG